MTLGMSMLLWGDDFRNESHMALFSRLREIGYEGVEIPLFQGKPAEYRQLGQRLSDLGLKTLGVSVCSPDNDPSSADAAVRAKGSEHLRWALECCAEGGFELLCGPFSGALGGFPETVPSQDAWKRAAEVLNGAAEVAGGYRQRIALEYLNRFEMQLITQAADSARMVREIGHPALGLAYDTFHGHIEEKDQAAAIDGCGKDLWHVQISECDRGTPGSGQVHWDNVFSALIRREAEGYQGWYSVEAFGRGVPSLAAATRIWRKHFESEDRLAQEGLAFVKASLSKARAAHKEMATS